MSKLSINAIIMAVKRKYTNTNISPINIGKGIVATVTVMVGITQLYTFIDTISLKPTEETPALLAPENSEVPSMKDRIPKNAKVFSLGPILTRIVSLRQTLLKRTDYRYKADVPFLISIQTTGSLIPEPGSDKIDNRYWYNGGEVWIAINDNPCAKVEKTMTQSMRGSGNPSEIITNYIESKLIEEFEKSPEKFISAILTCLNRQSD